MHEGALGTCRLYSDGLSIRRGGFLGSLELLQDFAHLDVGLCGVGVEGQGPPIRLQGAGIQPEFGQRLADAAVRLGVVRFKGRRPLEARHCSVEVTTGHERPSQAHLGREDLPVCERGAAERRPSPRRP